MLNYFFRSLTLDWGFVKQPLALREKVIFIQKKYWLLAKNLLFGFKKDSSSVILFGRKYYYDDRFGIAFLQSVFVDNYFISKYLGPDDVVVDIGANVGQFRFFCEHVLGTKRAYSFEPVAETYQLLKKNFPAGSFNYAISMRESVNMYVAATSLISSSIPTEQAVRVQKVIGARLQKVPAINQESIIGLIKIDTEGSELDALKACADLLKKTRYLLVEASLVRPNEGDAEQLIKYLKYEMPAFKLKQIGRIYRNKRAAEAVDLLFKNLNFP